MSGRLPCGEVDTVSRERSAPVFNQQRVDRMKEGPVHGTISSGVLQKS